MLNQSASAAGSAARLRLLLGFCAASVLLISRTNAIGVNFGQVSNSLPPDEVTLKLVQSTTINKLKIYSADPGVLTTFAGSGIDIVIGADNDQVQPMASTAGYALTWAQTNIAAYPNTSIVGVALGNEVLSYQPQLTPFLLPALQNLQAALVSLGLDRTVKLSSPSSLGIVANSFPPSYGEFLYYNGVMSPLLEFFAQTGSPFMVNVYPYFAYAAAPENISLDYVLFNPGAVPVYDSGSGLNYTNMFDAQVDAVYAAMSKLGYNNVTLSVTETGWPSAGDPDEAGANVVNAQLFNANLVKHIASGIGTPAKPGVTVDTYIFALYNEDMKPGPTSERNFGLYNTDGTPVYNSGLIASTQWYGPPGVVYPPPGAVPPVAYWPPPAPVLASPPPPYGVAQPPPVEYPPPPVSASPPPPYVVAQPPPVAYPSPPVSDSPPPPYCPPPPVSASPPPPDGAAQPPPQGYPPPVVATPPVPALSPPAPPVVVGTPPTAGWSPPPPPVVGDSPPPPPLVIASPPPPVVGDSPPPVVGTSPPPLVIAPPPGFDPTAPAPGTSPIVPTAPSPGVAPGPGGVGTWCIAKSDADAGQLQIALDWACSTGGANCSVLQVGGSCYTPNTLVAHASYAFDSYYQLNNRNAWDCFFSDTANITAVNPSFAGCPFP